VAAAGWLAAAHTLPSLLTHIARSPTPGDRGTLILGFEQATKYTVYDQDGNPVSQGRACVLRPCCALCA
jgi:hypothetical protein